MRRYLIFWFLLIFAFGILIFRLVQLSIFEGERNRFLADTQRIRLRKISAPRGLIYDRNNIPLVSNWPIYRLCQKDKCEIISRQKALELQAEGEDADLLLSIGRHYLLGESSAHLLGYLSEATRQEVEKKEYGLGDLVGRGGVEEQNDEILRGLDGQQLIETDTGGRILRLLGEKEPVAGKDLHLTIDSQLQKTAYQALNGKKGAVVAQNPETGEILALVSSPSFDPEDLNEAVLNNPDKPFFNRAISGAYPPGSTFKVVVSTAALEEGKITPETKIEDPGVITIGKYTYSNWLFTQRGRTEGLINLIRAIARSTDTFFYKVGEMVGANKLLEWAKMFGLGRNSGIDLPGENNGFLPDPQEGNWFLGNTYHLAIGQGSLGLTPLQVNQMTGVIASKGKICQPYVVQKEGGESQNCSIIKIKPETIKAVTEGMKGACSPGGTAAVFFDYKVHGENIACKTGTAEFNDPKGRTHAWFTAFAPAENAEIVVTALVEAGGEGSTVAAPIVKKVLEEYFRSP